MTSSNETICWSFPEVQHLDSEVERIGCINISHEDKIEKFSEVQNKLVERNNQIKELLAKIADLQSEQSNLQKIIESIVAEMKHRATQIDGQHIDLMTKIIKKICRNIIKKEISLDQEILSSIIKELTSKLNDGLNITISTSSDDFNHVHKHFNSSKITIVIDPQLHSGEIVISDGMSGYMQKIDGYISEILGNEYDR